MQVRVRTRLSWDHVDRRPPSIWRARGDVLIASATTLVPVAAAFGGVRHVGEGVAISRGDKGLFCPAPLTRRLPFR